MYTISLFLIINQSNYILSSFSSATFYLNKCGYKHNKKGYTQHVDTSLTRKITFRDGQREKLFLSLLFLFLYNVLFSLFDLMNFLCLYYGYRQLRTIRMLKKPRCGMRIINSLLLSGGGNPIASRGSLCSLGFMIGFLIRIKRTLIFGFQARYLSLAIKNTTRP